ncbi:hypothetical protein Bca4012_089597 [Brassica carinata]
MFLDTEVLCQVLVCLHSSPSKSNQDTPEKDTYNNSNRNITFFFFKASNLLTLTYSSIEVLDNDTAIFDIAHCYKSESTTLSCVSVVRNLEKLSGLAKSWMI